MQHERVVVVAGGVEVPLLTTGEVVVLFVHGAVLGVRNSQFLRHRAPPADLVGTDPALAQLLFERRGTEQIVLRHEVGEGVVVGQRRVFVRTRDAVDVRDPVVVHVDVAVPEPGGLDQDVQTGLAQELLVAGGVHITQNRGRDVGVDVQRGGPGRPIPGVLPARNRAPRVGRAGKPQLTGTVPGLLESLMPPAKSQTHTTGMGVRQQRQHERLGVPQHVAVVAVAGQPLRRDRVRTGLGPRLQHVEQPEPDALLHLRIAVELHVGAGPEVVEILALQSQQLVEAQLGRLVAGLKSPVHDIVLGPRVGQELLHPQRLPGGHAHLEHGPDQVLLRRHVRLADAAGVGDRRRDFDAAAPGAVVQHVVGVLQRAQRGLHGGRGARVVALVGLLLVGEQVGLDAHANVPVGGFDLVADGCDRGVRERDQPGAADAYPGAGRRFPVDVALQGSGAQVEAAFVAVQHPGPEVERLVVHDQPDELAVGGVDDRLGALGEPVPGLGVGEVTLLIEGIEVRPRHPHRRALIQVPAQTDMPIGQGEHRFRLAQRPGAQRLAGQAGLPYGPLLGRSDLTHRPAPARASPVPRCAGSGARSDVPRWLPTRPPPTAQPPDSPRRAAKLQSAPR